MEPYPDSHWNLANEAIDRLVAARNAAVVEIDTRLDINATGLRTAAAIESLIARVDVLVTTRLHGLVFASKNGVPVVAIDAMGDGAKILRQATTIGWPLAFRGRPREQAQLEHAFDYCLTRRGPAEASECGERARRLLTEIPDEFVAGVARTSRTPRDSRSGFTDRPRGILTVTPAAIQVVRLDQAGATSLEWSSEGAEIVEVHVDAPDGPLLSRSGPSGNAATGEWVSDGMTFFLQDVTNGLPLTSEHTLATAAVTVTALEILEVAPRGACAVWWLEAPDSHQSAIRL